MKKKLLILLLVFFTAAFSFGQEQENETQKKLPPFLRPLNLTFQEGASYGQITRIEKMENRSNLVKETFLAGAFFNMKTNDLWIVDFTLQVNAFYPFYNAFNGMHQFTKNKLLYAVDSYFGAVYSIKKFKYVNIDISFGMHYMYQLTDEYHMNYIGLGTLDTLEFPLTKRWSIINNYFFSYDNPNLGSNKLVQPFNASYQYHIDLGVRYSKKVENQFYYIGRSKE